VSGPLPDDIRIVPTAEAYIAGFHRCLDVVAHERRFLALEAAPPLEQTTAFVRGLMAAGHPQCLALAGDTVVGWCDVVPAREDPRTGWLGMGVLPEYRGQGVGRALITRTLAWAREIGLQRVQLDVYADNGRARRLYASLGFQQVAVRPRDRVIGGVPMDVIKMTLDLLTPTCQGGPL